MSQTLPVRDVSRDGSAPSPAQRCCPSCEAALPSARARYCSPACKQRAFRLRHPARLLPNLGALRQELRARGTLVAHTVYTCPACDERFVGQRRCSECQLFCRALGLGGACPDCGTVILLAELLEPDGEKGGF